MLKVPFGQKPDGTMVPAADQPSGLACDCICPACGSRLVARHARTSNIVSHFSHQNEDRLCEGAVESAVHLMAKQLIAESRRLYLPRTQYSLKRRTTDGTWKQVQSRPREARWFAVDRAVLEQWQDLPENGQRIRPDVVLEGNGETVLLEVLVTHAVGESKLAAVRQANWSLVELDLSDWSFDDLCDVNRLRVAVVESAAHKTWLWHSSWAEEEKALSEQLDALLRDAADAADEGQLIADYEPGLGWRNEMRARFGKLVDRLRSNEGGYQRIGPEYEWPPWAREFERPLRALLLPSDAFLRARFKDPFGWQLEVVKALERVLLGALVDYQSLKQFARALPGRDPLLVELYKQRHMQFDGVKGWSFLQRNEMSVLPKWNQPFDLLLQRLHKARLIRVDSDSGIRKIGTLRGFADSRRHINPVAVSQAVTPQPTTYVLQYAAWVYASEIHALESVQSGRADRLATCHHCKHVSAYLRKFLCLYCGSTFATEEGLHEKATGPDRIAAIARRLMLVPDDVRDRQWVKVIKEYLKPVLERVN